METNTNANDNADANACADGSPSSSSNALDNNNSNSNSNRSNKGNNSNNSKYKSDKSKKSRRPPANKATKNNKKTPSRGQGFSQAKTMHLLDVIENILPVCQIEWDSVARDHEKAWPNERRNVQSLKRKFQILYRTKTPTGDPNSPPEVKRAKAIYWGKIYEKTGMSEGDEEEANFPDSNEEEEDSDDDNDDEGVAEFGPPRRLALTPTSQ